MGTLSTARQHGAGRRAGGRLATIGVLVALFVITPAGLAAAAGNASVHGTVTDGVRGTPLSGAEVTLTTFTTAGQAPTKARTRNDGTYTFAGLASGQAQQYEVSISFDNGTYASESFTLGDGENRDVPLTVYPSTTAPDAVSLDSWVVWVDPGQAAVAVEQNVEVTNSAKTSYIGRNRTPDGQGEALSLPLAPGAGTFQYVGFLGSARSFVQSGTFYHTLAIPPGQSKGTLRYETRSLSTLNLPVTLPTRSFTLLVPVTVKVDAPGLSVGARRVDGSVTYQAYTAANLKVGDTLGIGLVIPTAAKTGKRSSTPMVVAGVLVVLILLGLLVMVRRQRAVGAASATAPVGGRESGGRPRGAGSRSSGSRSSGSRSPGSRSSGSQAAASRSSGSRSSGSQPAASRSSGSRSAGAPSTRTRQPGSRIEGSTAGAGTSNPSVRETTGEQSVGGRASDDAAELMEKVTLLDLAHTAGALDDEAAYQRRRAELVAQMRDLWEAADNPRPSGDPAR